MKKRSKRAKRQPLQQIVREAARVGAAEAIEHCQSFWNTSDGYRRYIDANMALEAQALKAAVRDVMHTELEHVLERALAKLEQTAAKSVKLRKRRLTKR